MLANVPLAFQHCTDVMTGTPAITTPGVFLTATNGANIESPAVTLIPALAHDVHFLVIGIGSGAQTGTASNALLDILLDRAGGTSWSAFIDDLICGFLPAPATTGRPLTYFFPIFIPAGASIGVQFRTPNLNGQKIVEAWAFGEPTRPDMWWCGQGVETLGAVPATSTGTTIVPGATGADGSWTNIGSPSTHRYGALQFGVHGPDSGATQKGAYWKVGFNNTQLPGSPTYYTTATTTEILYQNGANIPIFCDVPAGTQMQMMGTLSGAAENYQGCVYGVF